MYDAVLSFNRSDVHTATRLVEVNGTVYIGVNCVVFTEVDILAWCPLSATLTDDDVSSGNNFATKLLNAEALTA